MPMSYAAERAGISRSTLHKVERGDPGVALGSYASLLATTGCCGDSSGWRSPEGTARPCSSNGRICHSGSTLPSSG
jgi:hypothetical protein